MSEEINTGTQSLDALAQTPDSVISCVAGIGASAGGLRALEHLFQNLAADTGLTFIVVQHLSPDFKSHMDEILSRHSAMPILQAVHGVQLERNKVYLVPPKKHLSISDGYFVMEDIEHALLQRPIDMLFQMIAQSYGERSIAVVLSGTGSDGTIGLQAIHEQRGLTVAQEPESAEFDGMPLNAIATECVDLILPPDEIAQLLTSHGRDPTKRLAAEEFLTTEELSGTKLVFSLLSERYGIDFSDYKPSTVGRRIERRIRASKSKTVHEYADTLRVDVIEQDVLYHDLLIGVTKFFRDSEAFFALQAQINRIVTRLEPSSEFRIWCAGCATGEEPYTIAMLALEAFERVGKEVNLKILATDVHQGALDSAARGEYSAESLEYVTNERQTKHFRPTTDGGYRVDPDVRRHIVFARHNVVQDPPFTRLHIVTCRNLLIYLNTKSQMSAIASFHFALKPNGILMLGSSETPGKLQGEFEPIDPTWRIYRKILGLSPSIKKQEYLSNAIARGPRQLVNILNRDKPESLSFTGLLEAYDLLLSEFVECGLLLDEQRNILHVFGKGYRYLSSPNGRFTGNIMKLLEGETRTTIAAALVRARKFVSRRFILHNVEFKHEEAVIHADVTVRSLNSDLNTSFVWFVGFSDPERMKEIGTENVLFSRSGDDMNAIESELAHTKESLSATIEELETSNEELQSTNEELIASNEELQSTNEELHSVNEELYSVNSENHRKITELHEVTEDMNNLLSSTDIGTIFVDDSLKIRKFTAAVKSYFDLVEHDLGRQLGNFTHNLQLDDLPSLIKGVIATAETRSITIKNNTGQEILVKMIPYVSGSERCGAVLHLINLDEIRSSAQEGNLSGNSESPA